MSPEKKNKAQRVATDRVRAYEARQEVHSHVIARRKRDNLIATIAVVGVTLLAVGAQALHVAMTPTPPTATPTPEAESRPVPSSTIAQGREWTGTLSLNDIDLGVTLDGAAAPAAVSSTIELANSGFYNGVPCHRLVTAGIFVLQCGDPKGDGTGGPGYSYGPIENAPTGDFYPAGTIAMARQGGNATTQGSQFFIVYADSTIPSDSAGGYTVIGKVTSGLDKLTSSVINAGVTGGATDGQPATPVSINRFTLR